MSCSYSASLRTHSLQIFSHGKTVIFLVMNGINFKMWAFSAQIYIFIDLSRFMVLVSVDSKSGRICCKIT